MKEIPSPCMKICQRDSQGVCYGCRRNLEEIENWYRYSEEDKAAVIEKTHQRSNVPGEEPLGFYR
ncbi:MAG: DUF1289 domain-containing protein [Prolixibacteraceae bacterium]